MTREPRCSDKSYRNPGLPCASCWPLGCHPALRLFPLLPEPKRPRFIVLLTRAWTPWFSAACPSSVLLRLSGFLYSPALYGSETIVHRRYYLPALPRILIPVAGALCRIRLSLGTSLFFGESTPCSGKSPLWSLACEEIYYGRLSLLRWLSVNRFGWKSFLSCPLCSGGIGHRTKAILLIPSPGHDLARSAKALLLLASCVDAGCLSRQSAESRRGLRNQDMDLEVS